MKRLLFILWVVLLAGCRTPTHEERSELAKARDAALEAARQAVVQHEGRSWARAAEYAANPCMGDAWDVHVSKPTRLGLFGPVTYLMDDERSLLVNSRGMVVSYVRAVP